MTPMTGYIVAHILYEWDEWNGEFLQCMGGFIKNKVYLHREEAEMIAAEANREEVRDGIADGLLEMIAADYNADQIFDNWAGLHYNNGEWVATDADYDLLISKLPFKFAEIKEVEIELEELVP